MLLKILWYKLSYLIFTPLDPNPNKKLGAWIRIHMDIFGILDPDPQKMKASVIKKVYENGKLMILQNNFIIELISK